MPQNSREFFFTRARNPFRSFSFPTVVVFLMVSIILVIPAFPLFNAALLASPNTLDRYYSSLWYYAPLKRVCDAIIDFSEERPLLLLFSLYHSVLQCKSRKNVAVSKSPSFEHRFNFPFIFVGRGLGRGHWY